MVKEEIVEAINGGEEEQDQQHEEVGAIAGGEEDEAVSTLTMERVAAAKKFIENHYRSQMKHIQERKERYISFGSDLFVLPRMCLTNGFLKLCQRHLLLLTFIHF